MAERKKPRVTRRVLQPKDKNLTKAQRADKVAKEDFKAKVRLKDKERVKDASRRAGSLRALKKKGK